MCRMLLLLAHQKTEQRYIPSEVRRFPSLRIKGLDHRSTHIPKISSHIPQPPERAKNKSPRPKVHIFPMSLNTSSISAFAPLSLQNSYFWTATVAANPQMQIPHAGYSIHYVHRLHVSPGKVSRVGASGVLVCGSRPLLVRKN